MKPYIPCRFIGPLRDEDDHLIEWRHYLISNSRVKSIGNIIVDRSVNNGDCALKTWLKTMIDVGVFFRDRNKTPKALQCPNHLRNGGKPTKSITATSLT